ncbi:MAG: ImmA/IrrE family metallo-endopeptidase [Rhodocyclaceae bacterium]|nr:ImmA/IrrE family metallo-endopeptidase [Rhodocyclaceae bacterium]
MTAPSNRITSIFGSLEAAGYPRDLQRLLLPDWVTADVLSDEAASAEVATILAKRLGLRPTSLFSRTPHIEALRRRDTKYKRSIPSRSKNLTAATAVAVAVAESIAAACHIPFSPFPNAAPALRQVVLTDFPGKWLGLRNLLMCCWAHGVPVVYLAEIGQGVSKMDGMVVQTDDRPVIVLSKSTDLWAWQLFVLAHEVAHVALGHVEPDEILVDEELGKESYAMEDPDLDERAADAFAIELLNGRPDASYRVSEEMVNAPTLAKAAFDHGISRQIDPGHIVLNFAHRSGEWATGVAAAKLLQAENPPAASVINEAMWREFDLGAFSDDNLEFLRRATGTIAS